MENELRLNGKPAVRIFATKIRDYKNSTLCNCEGDEIWFPTSKIKIEEKEGTILIEEWLYKSKFEGGYRDTDD